MKALLGKLLHVGGAVIQLAAGGAFTLLGASPKVASGAFVIGTLLSAFGVHIQLPPLASPPSGK